MSFSSPRNRLAAAGTVTLAAAVALSLPATAQATTYRAYSGSAYGSTVKVGEVASSGKTSLASLCTTSAPQTSSNNTAKVTLPVIGRIGAATTKVSSSKNSTAQATTSTTTTGSTSLLGGLVQATAVTSTAKVKHYPSGYVRTGSTVFTNLRVAGTSVTATPGPNTTITIPDVATVRLNTQATSSTGGAHILMVTALRITLLAGNRLDLPTGDIVVGVASSNLRSPVHRLSSGSAYGTMVNVAGTVKSGATAAVGLPCGGSGGLTLTNSVASASLGSALQAGAVHSAATSTDTATKTVATTSNSIADVSLLGGIVSIDAVDTRASTTRKGSTVTSRSSTGTRISGLRINGLSRAVSSAENSQITIAGVGTLYLHRAIRTSTSVQVYAVQLKLSTARNGLGVGTVITVGAAKAGVAAR